MAVSIGAVRRWDEFGYFRVKRGDDGREVEDERSTFKAATGHRGERGRWGI